MALVPSGVSIMVVLASHTVVASLLVSSCRASAEDIDTVSLASLPVAPSMTVEP